MKNYFTEHPNSIGESYFEHLKFALIFGGNLLLGGIAGVLHAFFPFVFIKTGSNFLFKSIEFYIERLPKLDDKVLYLEKLIERKKRETGTK